MQPDDEICYCFRVSLGKLVNFARRVRPQRPSQMSECLGAGTGCGWCIPLLLRIANDPDGCMLDDLVPDECADQRRRYIHSGRPRNTF